MRSIQSHRQELQIAQPGMRTAINLPDVPVSQVKRGDVIKLRLFNDPSSSHAMAHPIHLHGQRFLVLTRDGVRSENLVWKDTAIIPAGEIVELLVDMANPGKWMLHCHIAEHLSGGRMATFTVQ